MIKKIIKSILVFSLMLTAAMPVSVLAAETNIFSVSCKDNSNQPICKQANQSTLPQLIKRIADIMLFILGAISVIMVIVGGIRYVTSGGDPQQVKAAKDTVLYAVIGIVIAILAYAIVSFVVNQFAPGTPSAEGAGTGSGS